MESQLILGLFLIPKKSACKNCDKSLEEVLLPGIMWRPGPSMQQFPSCTQHTVMEAT